MILHYPTVDRLRQLFGGDASRARPIAFEAGGLLWKPLRRLARRARAALASARFTVVAAKARRLQRELAFRGVRYHQAPARTTRGRL